MKGPGRERCTRSSKMAQSPHSKGLYTHSRGLTSEGGRQTSQSGRRKKLEWGGGTGLQRLEEARQGVLPELPKEEGSPADTLI